MSRHHMSERSPLGEPLGHRRPKSSPGDIQASSHHERAPSTTRPPGDAPPAVQPPKRGAATCRALHVMDRSTRKRTRHRRHYTGFARWSPLAAARGGIGEVGPVAADKVRRPCRLGLGNMGAVIVWNLDQSSVKLV